MQEELFSSGRNIPNIDPTLEIWHWPISVYLFLGGLAAGVLFFMGLLTILNKDKEFPTASKYASVIPPIALTLGLIALFYDLTHKFYFWQLYTTVRIESPMSWGAWVLLVVTPLSYLWVFSFASDIFPSKIASWKWIQSFEKFLKKYQTQMAYALIPLSIILGVYTGILLSAFNARPLWNNAILGPLFLTSGLSTGAACIILLSKNKSERHLFNKIDLGLIVIEIGLIIHMLMGMYAGSAAQIEALNLLIGGEYTTPFFGFVLILGLIIPAIMEALELRGFRIPTLIPAVLVLIGGLIFRFVMVEAGQLAQFLY